MQTLIIHENTLTFDQTIQLERAFGKLTQKENYFQATPSEITPHKIKALSQKLELDINLLPENFHPENIKLVISDMDSTLISIECVDEIADMLDLKPQVSNITEAAMRGELDFENSLRKRVALLEGLETHALERVYNERLCLNPGAEKWITGLKSKGIEFALVSGGFTYFTDRLHQQLELDHSKSNALEILDGKLTGKVAGKIIGAQAKADFLLELCQLKNISPSQVIAIGDGANDLLMMQEAGLSIAYHAKPTVQAQAQAALNYRGLDAVLDFVNE